MTNELLSLDVLSSIRSALLAGFRESLAERRALEMRPPTLVDVTGACENVNTLIEVSGSSGSTTRGTWHRYMSQTGQLSLEKGIGIVDEVWCLATSYRDDKPDERHLREFELVEHEFSTEQLTKEHPIEALLEVVTQTVQTGLRSVLEKDFDLNYIATQNVQAACAVEAFPVLRYTEALERVNRGRSPNDQLRFGDDLGSLEERVLMADVAEEVGTALPLFVTHFPESLKFFNMKLDPEDATYALSADLLLPVAGEAVGAAVREDNSERLSERLLRSEMLRILSETDRGGVEDFAEYVALIASDDTPSHAGYGIGLERVIQFVTAASDIRTVSLPSRLACDQPTKEMPS